MQDLTPLFTITSNFSICAGTSLTITVTPINYNNSDVIYSWTLNGNPIQGNSNQITVTQSGTYVVTVNNSGCLNTGQTVVIVVPVPTPDAPTNVTACNNYTLPLLISGNYYTQPLGGGTLLQANTIITSSQTLYVFAQSGTVPNCTAQNSFTITINPFVTTQFTQIPAICRDLAAPSLPTTSTNTPIAITGTWNPNTISTSTVGTSTYTFTPNVGFCASTTTMDITIVAPSIIPLFQQIPPICLNGVAPLLPVSSSNGGITGSWSPSIINTSIVGSSIYIFTPNTGQCAVPTNMSITILAPTVATFNQIASICQGGNAPALPTSSSNTPTPITGTWSPLTISTATVGTSTYTFTPTIGLCATGTTMQVTILPNPVVNPINNVAVCNSYTLPPLDLGNYFAQPNGVSPITNLTLTSTQLVYVYAQSGTTPNCTDQESFQVNITPSPQFIIEGGCVESVYVLEVIPTDPANFNVDTANYNWSGPSVPNNGQPTLQVTEAGVYTCIVSVSNGSESNCSTTHTFNANDIGCQIPKGISPNGDTLNDTFDLSGFNVSVLSIFNRYGTKVYSKSDYKNEWGGQSNSGNELADGTYYYVIELKNGGKTKTGWVYINKQAK